ncbi:unnamed protein product [Diamesa tonsa]
MNKKSKSVNLLEKKAMSISEGNKTNLVDNKLNENLNIHKDLIIGDNVVVNNDSVEVEKKKSHPVDQCQGDDDSKHEITMITVYDKNLKLGHEFPLMQCGTLKVPTDKYHRRRRPSSSTTAYPNSDNSNMEGGYTNTPNYHHYPDYAHSDGGSVTPPPSPSSSSSIVSLKQQQLLQQQLDQQRLAVLSFEQVNKLNDVMNECVSIHGRGNFPTLEVKLKDFVTLVRERLELDQSKGGAGMCVKDIRLNGGAASHVLAHEAQSYNDLDLIFAVEFSTLRHFDRVKSAVLSTLCDLLPETTSTKRITQCSLKEAYVGKMVKVNNEGDRWSLISLGNSTGHKNVELKFVDTMRRQFEFSVDSFQIILDSLLLFYDCAALPISENFYPTVVGESVYGDFHEALYHLQHKLISTRQPEEIRGGGLLKYCNLLVRNYIPVDSKKIKKLERYMCSRFFIDFPDILQQKIKLEAYLRNHFWGIDEEPLQYHYLVHLHDVVETSTVCLMGHERRQTLSLIEHLAIQVSCRERQKMQHQQQQLIITATTTSTVTPTHIQLQPTNQPGLLYANGIYYAPVIPVTCTCPTQWVQST